MWIRCQNPATRRLSVIERDEDGVVVHTCVAEFNDDGRARVNKHDGQLLTDRFESVVIDDESHDEGE